MIIKSVRQLAIVDISNELKANKSFSRYCEDGKSHIECWTLSVRDVFSNKQTKLNRLLKLNVINYQKK